MTSGCAVPLRSCQLNITFNHVLTGGGGRDSGSVQGQQQVAGAGAEVDDSGWGQRSGVCNGGMIASGSFGEARIAAELAGVKGKQGAGHP